MLLTRRDSESRATWSMFAFSWAFAIELGMSSQGMATTPMRVVVTLVGLLVLCWPASPLLLGLLALSWCVHLYVDTYGALFVHHWLTTLGSWGILLALATTLRRDPDEWRTRATGVLAIIGPAIATIALMAAGFSKLNHGFFDLEIGCGAVFLQWQQLYLPWSLLPYEPRVSIAFTLLAELGSPFLLWPRATRKLGLLLTTGFFLAIGTNHEGRLYEFAALFLALFSPLFGWGGLALPRMARLVPIVLVLVAMTADEKGSAAQDVRFAANRPVYVVFLAAYAALAFRNAVPRWSRLSGFSRLAWLVPLIALLLEVLPYLGMRTYRNFTMAGNFAVNTMRSHHFVVRDVPDLGFNRIAVVTSSTSTSRMKRGTALPVFVVEDYVARNPKASVTYRVGDEVVTVTPETDHSPFQRSWIAPLLDFQPTWIRDTPPPCGHGPPKP